MAEHQRKGSASTQQRIAALIFDLDDTLYPERQYALSGFRAVARAFENELGDPEQTAADCERLFDSNDRARVFDALLLERLGELRRPLLGRMIETYRHHFPIVMPYPDVNPALLRWRGGYKLGLITDGRSHAQWAKIDALNLRSRFDHIIVTSDLRDKTQTPGSASAYCKPHPRAFQEMSASLDAPHNACVYVADNLSKDFVAPNSLGWLTVRILRADAVHRGAPCAENGKPMYTIRALDELDVVLLQPNSGVS